MDEQQGVAGSLPQPWMLLHRIVLCNTGFEYRQAVADLARSPVAVRGIPPRVWVFAGRLGWLESVSSPLSLIKIDIERMSYVRNVMYLEFSG